MKINSKKAITLLVLTTLLMTLVPAMPMASAAIDPDDKFYDSDGVELVSINEGDKGDTIALKGTGVTAGAVIEVYWDSVTAWDGETGLLNSSTGESSGAYLIWFDVPESVAGEHWVWVRDAASGDNERYPVFEVVPKLSVSPSSGLVGDTITVTGSGFNAEEDVMIFYDSPTVRFIEQYGDELSTAAWDLDPVTPFTDEVVKLVGGSVSSEASAIVHITGGDAYSVVNTGTNLADYGFSYYGEAGTTKVPELLLRFESPNCVDPEDADSVNRGHFTVTFSPMTGAYGGVGAWYDTAAQTTSSTVWVFGNKDDGTPFNFNAVSWSSAYTSVTTLVGDTWVLTQVGAQIGWGVLGPYYIKDIDADSVVYDLASPVKTVESDDLGSWETTYKMPDPSVSGDFTAIGGSDNAYGTKTFVVGAGIELNVDDGPSGTVVEISGRGFVGYDVSDVDHHIGTDISVDDPLLSAFDTLAQGSITINGVAVKMIDAPFVVDTDGEFVGEIVIPKTAAIDEYPIIVLATGVENTANADFDVLGLPEVEVTPGHGTQGSIILVEGWNFTAGEDVRITVGGLGLEEYEVGNDGSFSVTYAVPAVSTGEHTVLATQIGYTLSDTTTFRAGIMIVILNPTSGPAGTSVTLTGTGFTSGDDWNATFGDETWVDDATATLTEISDNTLYVPSVEAGVYTVTIWDIEADIKVEVEFEVTANTYVETDPVIAPAGYDVILEGYYFMEGIDALADIDEFVFYNDTEEWTGAQMGWTINPNDDDIADDWEDGYFALEFSLPDEDDLSVGSYTLNVTDNEGMWTQLVFEIVEETIDIESRKSEFSIGDTLAFDVESSFPMADSYIEISDPSGDLYWSTDEFSTSSPDMWLTVGNIQRVLYADQVAGGNPMVFLEDAPLGSWTWEYIDPLEDDPIDIGAFTVSAGTESVVSGQVDALAADIDALVDDISALADEIVDYSSSFDSVAANIAAVADLAADAVAAAEAAADAVSSVASVAGDAATAAENAADAANDARDAATGLTTLVYGAIGASLVAALAAIVSLMQISRRIAG